MMLPSICYYGLHSVAWRQYNTRLLTSKATKHDKRKFGFETAQSYHIYAKLLLLNSKKIFYSSPFDNVPAKMLSREPRNSALRNRFHQGIVMFILPEEYLEQR